MNAFPTLPAFGVVLALSGNALAAFLAVSNLAAAQATDSKIASTRAPASAVPTLEIDAGKVTAHVSPIFYGLMTEEINFSYEGGLYGELIRNRTFKASETEPQFWTATGGAEISLDKTQPLNAPLGVSLKMDAGKASENTPAGISNGGYWGIPVRPDTTYHASFYARSEGLPLVISLQSTDGKMVFGKASVPKISGEWKKYEVSLKTRSDVQPSKDNQLVITTDKPGTVWFQQVSLFPPTYNNRSNGLRPDLMELMAAMKPKFLRFPGGNYVEGGKFKERFNWKETIGDISQRPGHRSPWNYWSTDGMGLLEFLGWCEDLKMEPVLAVFAGYTLNRDHVNAGPELEPYVQEALEEIEYVTGDTNTKWGAQRAKDGHPAPFSLRYVEIGNEDGADRSHTYQPRFAQFYDAIRAKYPNLRIIDTCGPKYWDGFTAKVERTPDLVDEHYYCSEVEMESHALDYDKYPRVDKPKVFVGEWATRVGSPTPNMAGALGDAAWMTGMERNADVVTMQCYAPLFTNVSDLKPHVGSMQWPTDLIGYDALSSYGSPSYYAQVMFSNHLGNDVLATNSQNIPMREWQPPAPRRGAPVPPAQQIRKLFFNATRDSKSGTIYLKVVNSLDTAQLVKIQISGVAAIEPEGKAIVLKASKLSDTNTIKEPKKIVPAEENVSGLGASFTREFPPYSITVLELKSS